VLDNLAAHRASRIEEITAECGARVIWLPYSPDFSPIELMWSKVKAYLRKVRARTQTELEKAIAAALKTIRASDCVNNTPSETSRAATHWSAASLVFIGFIK
jgi:transposase